MRVVVVTALFFADALLIECKCETTWRILVYRLELRWEHDTMLPTQMQLRQGQPAEEDHKRLVTSEGPYVNGVSN